MTTFSTKDYSYAELNHGGNWIRAYGRVDAYVTNSGSKSRVSLRPYVMADCSLGDVYGRFCGPKSQCTIWPIDVPGLGMGPFRYSTDTTTPIETFPPGTSRTGIILANKVNEITWEIERKTYDQTIKFSFDWKSDNLEIHQDTWFVDKTTDLSGSSRECSVMVPALDRYVVQYDANGGYSAPTDQYKWYGMDIVLSSAKPSRTGHRFVGWAVSPESNPVYQPGSTYSADVNVTLYAIWERETYAVTYDANGGTGAPASQTKTYGINLTLSSTKPSRSGYSFAGWGANTSASVSYQPGGTYTANGPVKLVAVWRKLYDVVYHGNATSSETVGNLPSNQQKVQYQSLKISSSVPTRTGYVFRGWAVSPTSSTVYLSPGGTYTADANLDLYAIWAAIYTMRYDDNVEDAEIEVPPDQVKYSDRDIVIPNVVPVRDGWVFSAWSLKPDEVFPTGSNTYFPGSTIRGDFSGYSVNGIVKLYAIWRQTAYSHIASATRDGSGGLDVTVSVIGSGTLKVEGLTKTDTQTVDADGTVHFANVDTSTLTVSLDVSSADGLRAPLTTVTVPSDNVPGLAFTQDADGKTLGASVMADPQDGYFTSGEPIVSEKVIANEYRIGNAGDNHILDRDYVGKKSWWDSSEVTPGMVVIDLNVSTEWMGSFKVLLYGSYTMWELSFSGYNYNDANYPGWFRPKCEMISASQGVDGSSTIPKIQVWMGYYEKNKLWVAFPDLAWRGLTIQDFVSSHAGHDMYRKVTDLFTVRLRTDVTASNISTTLGPVDMTRAVQRPFNVGDGDILDLAHGGTGNDYNSSNGLNSKQFSAHHTSPDGVFGYKNPWTGGYTTIHELRKALKVFSLRGAYPDGSLGQNVNLNTLTTVGNYSCAANDYAKNYTNCPTTYAFNMRVIASLGQSADVPTYIIQDLTDIFGRRFTRYSHNSGGSWSSWTSNAQLLVNSTGYPQIVDSPGIGVKGDYVRAPANGILPVSSGSAGSGHGMLGTSSWYWKNVYSDYYYGNWVGNKIPISKGGTNGTTVSEARQNLSVPSIISKNGFWGLGYYNGSDIGWMRSTTSGFLPHNSGGSSAVGSLGTTGWPWFEMWTMYGHCKGDLRVGESFTYQIAMGGGSSSYVWIDARTNSNTVINNLVLHTDRTETKGGAIVTSAWDGNNIREIHRADNYLHITTRSYGAKGVSWWDSDIRVKENIEVSETPALDVIDEIVHRSFDMISTGRHYRVGYIAQELEKLDENFVLKVPESRDVDGEWVFTGDYNYQIDDRGLIPYLSKAIQELSGKVRMLEARIEELEGGA